MEYHKPDHLADTSGSVDLGRVDQLTISELPEESIDNDNVASSIEECCLKY